MLTRASRYLLSGILLSMVIGGIAPRSYGGSNFYVDKIANGLNNGTSWASAWESFTDIDWSVITHSDTVFISGGSSSKRYYETLEIQASGVEGGYITVTKGVDNGHDGDVILDGQAVRQNGIYLRSYDHIRISGLHLRNFIGSGSVRIRNAQGVLIEELDILVTGHGGVWIDQSINCIVRNNYMSTPTLIDEQTDGIYAQHNSGNVYENNYIIITNSDPEAHCDGIQLFEEDGSTIRGNYIEQANFKTSNAQGIYIERSHGTHLIYNNVVVCPNTGSHLIGFRNLDDGTGEVEVYNNTAIGMSGSFIRVSGNYPKIKNNILYKTKSGNVLIFESPVYDFGGIDYNLFYMSGDGAPVYYVGDSISWAEWKALGADIHSLQTDPLIYPDGRLQADSPCIDAGVDLDNIFNTDKRGVQRFPGHWDIGAYEFSLDAGPPAPTKLRIRQ